MASADSTLTQRQKYAHWLDSDDQIVVANAMLLIIGRALNMLKRQIESQGKAFEETGGFSERHTAARVKPAAKLSSMLPTAPSAAVSCAVATPPAATFGAAPPTPPAAVHVRSSNVRETCIKLIRDSPHSRRVAHKFRPGSWKTTSRLGGNLKLHSRQFLSFMPIQLAPPAALPSSSPPNT